MARMRSPNYPQISLPEAISRVGAIFDKEKGAAPKEVVAGHLGYGSLNGASMGILSALQKYGLLEEVNGKGVRVTERAKAILHPRDREEKARAIREAASLPALFGEIKSEWPDTQPSDANLRSWLIRRSFSDDAATRAIATYRATLDLVTQQSGEYDSASAAREADPKPGSGPMHTAGAPPAFKPPPPPPPGGKPYSITFNGEAIQVGGDLRDAVAVEGIISALNALKGLLPAKQDSSAETSEGED